MRFEDLTPAEQAEVIAEDRLARRTRTVVLALMAIVVVIAAVGCFGVIDLDDTRNAHAVPVPSKTATDDRTSSPDVTSTTTMPPRVVDPGPVAEAAAPPVRGSQVQVAETVPAPSPVPVWPNSPGPVPGDCDSWRTVFAGYGATAAELEFFIDGGILWRETRCGTDFLNDATGDSGICQINPVHNRAGYFGGRPFGDGGWLLALHGLRTRHQVSSPDWSAACLTLFRVCGPGAWTPPAYRCANHRLEDVT